MIPTTTSTQKPADMSKADYDFLMAKKAEGVSFEEAKAALVKAKKGYLEQASPTVSFAMGIADKAKQAQAEGKLTPEALEAASEEEKQAIINATKQGGDFMATTGAVASGEVAKGLGNLAKATDYINPVAWEAKLMGKGEDTFGTQTQEGAEWLAKQPMEVQEKIGTTETTGGEAGEVAGTILGTVAKQVPALVGGAELLSGIKAVPAFQLLAKATPEKAAKIIDFITKSVGTTELISQTEEAELASPTELGAFALVDLATQGLGRLGKSLYKSAFKGTKGEEKALINAYEKKVADIAEELGYSGTEEQIKTEAKGTAKTIWKEIQQLAHDNKIVTRKQFIETILPKLLKETNKLPKSTVRTQMIDIITKTVEEYAPTVSASGTQLIQSIKQINKGLFGEGTRSVLSPRQMASLESNLKSEIKGLLPEEIKPLYEQYAKNKLIEKIMADESIKRYIARSGMGATTGAISGATTGIPSGDPYVILRNTIIGALSGSVLGGLTGSTYTATKGGKALQKVDNEAVTSLVKIIAEKLTSEED